MGLFDFLKDWVYPKKTIKPKITPKPTPKPKLTLSKNNNIIVDNRKYPLLYMNKKIIICGNMDDNIAIGQCLQITIVIDDTFAKFSFPTKIYIDKKSPPNYFVGSFVMITPNMGKVIEIYNQKKG